MAQVYICGMEDMLFNPVYHALLTGDKDLALGNGRVKYFDESVSPFAGFPDDFETGFDDLHMQLPRGRKILYAIPERITEPMGWKLVVAISGLQFVHRTKVAVPASKIEIIPLDKSHASEMVQLAAMTKPGPFEMRTIEFGYYHGIFEKNKLVAMTGQRLHPGNYSEVSAVCTHPDHLGKGYAAALLDHQVALILEKGQIPFLHVRDDNERAIALYKRLGFEISRPMHFYFLIRR